MGSFDKGCWGSNEFGGVVHIADIYIGAHHPQKEGSTRVQLYKRISTAAMGE